MASPQDFLVGEVIGEGSFGVALHCRHKITNRDVVIKVIDKVSLLKRPAWLNAAKAEQRLLQQLSDCPYTVNLWASFHDSECVYIALECCAGGDLAHVINSQRNEDLWEESASNYARQIIEGMEAIHERQIVHADLKPENVLLKGDGRIQLADFGSAVDISVDQSNADVSVRGTSDYASPEILHGSQNITAAADWWSFGCILHALRTGQSPFRANSDALAVQKVLQFVQDSATNNDRLANLNAETHSLLPFVSMLLDPDPEERIRVGRQSVRDSIIWEGVDPRQPPPLLPLEPSWLTKSKTVEMKDGGEGWSAFLV